MVKFAKLALPFELPVNYTKLTQPQRATVRNMYIGKQKGLCYFCKQPLDEKPLESKPINWRLFPKGFLKHPVHLHHSHKTGMTLGAVHSYCNAYLWQYLGE